MKKSQYLNRLRVELIRLGLKKSEIDGALQYYGELIDEAVENGGSEEAAISRLPSPVVAAKEIADDGTRREDAGYSDAESYGGNRNGRGAKRPKSLTEKIILLTVFAIILFPIIIAVVSVVFSVLATFLAVVAAFLACGVAIPIYAVIIAVAGESLMLFFSYFAVGLLFLGLGLLMIRVCTPVARLLWTICKKSCKTLVSFIS